jgi:UDP-N-acetylglucosamine 2-epimerase (non-hydrolysing)
VEVGTNILVGTNADDVREEALKVLDGKIKKGLIPQYWDGRAAERIVKHLGEVFTELKSNQDALGEKKPNPSLN